MTPAEAPAPRAPATGASSWALFSTIMNVIGRASTLLAWLFLTPFILRHLGEAEFGVWVLVGAIAGYIRLVELGVGSGVTRSIRQQADAGDVDGMSRTVSSATRAYLGLGLLALPLALVAGPVCGAIWSHELTYLVPISGVAVVLGLPSLVPIAALGGLGRFGLANAIVVFGMGLFAVLIVIVIEGDLGLGWLVLVEGLASAITTVPAVLVLRHAAPGVRFRRSLADPATSRELLRFGRPLAGVTLSAQLQSQSDELLIGLLGSATAVTPYALARRIAEVPRTAATSFGRVVLPMASGVSHDPRQIRQVFVASTRVCLAIVLATTCPLLPLARPFLSTWAGPQYVTDIEVSWILLLATAVELVSWPAANILQAIVRHGILGRQALICAAINIGFSIALFRPYGVGGVAFATILSSIVGTVIVLHVTLREIVLPLRRFLVEAVAPPGVAAVPTLLAGWLATRVVAPSSLPAIAAVALVGGVVYLVVYLALPSADLERELARSLLRRVLALRGRRGRSA